MKKSGNVPLLPFCVFLPLGVFLLCVVIFCGLCVTPVSAQERSPGDAAATSYAPIEVLNAQIQATVAELAEKMNAGEAYWDENAAEVRRLANVLAVFAQVAGLHDQYCPAKNGATNIIDAGKVLAKVSTYAEAQAAWTQMQEALASTDSKNLAWSGPAGSFREVTQSIALYDQEISERIKKRRGLDKVAGRAVAMAVLFQGMTAMAHESPKPENAVMWQEFCMRCRDASYFLHVTLEVSDRKYSPKNYEILHKHCAECHQEFGN